MLQKSWNSVCRIEVCASSTSPQFLLDQYQVEWAAQMHSSKPEIQRDSKRFCQDSVSACLSLSTSLQSLQDLQMRQVTVCNGGFMLGRVSSRAADNLSSTSAGSVALGKSRGRLGATFDVRCWICSNVWSHNLATAPRRNQLKSHNLQRFITVF